MPVVYVYPSPANAANLTYIVEQDNGTWFERMIFDGPSALFNATQLAQSIAGLNGSTVSFSQGETVPIIVPSPSPGY